MSTFVVAYLTAWLAVALYAVRLGTTQRRMQRTVEALQVQFDRKENAEDPPCEAA